MAPKPGAGGCKPTTPAYIAWFAVNDKTHGQGFLSVGLIHTGATLGHTKRGGYGLKFYCTDKESVLRQTGSTETGLSAAEAAARLEKNGRNKLAEGKKDSLLKRFFQQMTDPMIIILLAAAAISGVLAVVEGESFADVIIILAVVIINAVLGVYQENKAEKAIEALQEMSAATSRVLRDGKITVVRSEELVVGDVVLLEAGDAVPADGVCWRAPA